jgi:hypothetical protein
VPVDVGGGTIDHGPTEQNKSDEGEQEATLAGIAPSRLPAPDLRRHQPC